MSAALHTHKNLDIEVLRAIAVLMILVDHIKFLLPWPGIADGVHALTSLWGGVDVFFAISGFVITSMFLREAERTRFIIFAVPFWIRRIYRIWPSAVSWMVVILIASVAFNKSGAFGDVRGNFFNTVSMLLQVANFHQYHCTTGFGVCGVSSIYWSLSLEEQFYIVYPFLFFFAPRRYLPWLLGFSAVTLLFVTRIPHSFLWWIRTDALAWGALVALATRTRAHAALAPRFLASPWRAAGFTLLIAFLIASIGTNMVIPFQTGVIALLSALLVWVASYNQGYSFPSGIFRRLLLWIGSRSYALYLIHPFAYYATREIFFRAYPNQTFNDDFLFLFLLVGFALLFTLAELNYRFLEYPLRQRGVCHASKVREHIQKLTLG